MSSIFRSATFRSRTALRSLRPLATTRNDLFRLNSEYVESYSMKAPPFGFNGLGELVFMRTYSRSNDMNQKESWYQTVERVSLICWLTISSHSLVGCEWDLHFTKRMDAQDRYAMGRRDLTRRSQRYVWAHVHDEIPPAWWVKCDPGRRSSHSLNRSWTVGDGISSHTIKKTLCCFKQLCFCEHRESCLKPHWPILFSYGRCHAWCWCWLWHSWGQYFNHSNPLPTEHCIFKLKCWRFSRRMGPESSCSVGCLSQPSVNTNSDPKISLSFDSSSRGTN
jgi:hypothetical protein